MSRRTRTLAATLTAASALAFALVSGAQAQDKTIKIYKEDDSASEETHPINWKPEILKRRRF